MGGREQRIGDDEILRLFAMVDDPVLSTSEVAESFDYSNAGMRDRLLDLHSRGHLGHKVAGQTSIWWLTVAGEYYIENEADPGW